MIELSYFQNGLAGQISYAIITVLVSYIILKIVHKSIDKISRTAGATKRIRLTMNQAKHYSKPVKILVNLVATVIVALMILNIFGLQGSFLGVLSAAGFLGIVVGFGAKDMLSNMIAGFIIFMDQPFIIGDWIRVGEIEGTVVDMKVASTRIMTFGGELVSIPNSVIETERIINKTHEGKLRVKGEVSIDYTADLDKAITLATQYMKKSSIFMQDPEPSVLVTELGESGIHLDLRAWVNPKEQSAIEAKHTMLTNIKRIFDENKIKIPYQQIEVSQRK